jgi:hypothetical protein
MAYSDILVVNGVDSLSVGIFVHEVDPGPISSSLCITARLVFLDLFRAFLLPVPLDFAEVAEFPVSIVVTSAV